MVGEEAIKIKSATIQLLGLQHSFHSNHSPCQKKIVDAEGIVQKEFVFFFICSFYYRIILFLDFSYTLFK